MKTHQLANPAYLTAMLAVLCLAQPCVWAQTKSGYELPTGYTSQSWTATDELQNPILNPTRTVETHTEGDGRTVDNRAIERLGVNGRYEPYSDVERETVRVDAATIRTVERIFGGGPDRQKRLFRQTEAETRTLPGGEQELVRTTSDTDVNGRLQIVRREIQDRKQISANVQETKTTVLRPDINGGFVAILQSQERETRSSDHVVELRKSTQLPDGNGRWQLNELRESVIEEKGQERTTEERLFRPDAEGRLAVVERTVSKESKSAPGEKLLTVEAYSTFLTGASGDGHLHLNRRVTTVERAQPDGGRATEEQIEQRNPASPNEGLRITQKMIDIVRPGAAGATEEDRTVQSPDSKGGLAVVQVEIRKTVATPPI